MEEKTKGANDAVPQVGKDLRMTEQERKDHGREVFEREHNCKLIKWAELMDNPWDADFGMKLKQLARYGNVDSVMLISKPKDGDKNWVTVNFYTDEHVYSIHVHWADTKENSYLGSTVSTRKNRPGECWNRGNDLPDGKYNDETWDDILKGIIRYEMKTLQI
jgi:hypothetical protein